MPGESVRAPYPLRRRNRPSKPAPTRPEPKRRMELGSGVIGSAETVIVGVPEMAPSKPNQVELELLLPGASPTPPKVIFPELWFVTVMVSPLRA
jgi:hypothetical protein